MTEATATVDREEVRVMFRRTAPEQEAITRTWSEVEAVIGSLRGRKFYGAFDPATNEYLVCVQRRDDDAPEALGLEEKTLPAGGMHAGGLRGSRPPSTS